MSIGAHLSIAGGISNAVESAVRLDCSAFQCFSGNPRGWKQKQINSRDALEFRHMRAEAGIYPVAVHGSYLINLSSPDPDLFSRSVDLFTTELKRADSIGAEYLVVHLGSHRGSGIEAALKRVASGVIEASGHSTGVEVEILLENTAGSGETVGAELDQIAAVLDSLKREGIKAGLCYDTCHGFAAGHPLSSVADAAKLANEIEAKVGLKRLKLIHLNDSKGEAGSRLDRHEHLGKGKIGLKPLKAFVSHKDIVDIPLILETPKTSDEDDRRNLAAAKRMRHTHGG